jgi:ABC-type lipoprotein export system ATPase subunit
MNKQSATSSEAHPLIRITHLTKSYVDGGVNALVDVNLVIEDNEYVAIMGPSGCGKSTLLSVASGLDVATSGDVFYRGVPLSKMKNRDAFRAKTIGFVFQSFYLLPTLTAEENVQIPMFEQTMTAKQRTVRARELLATVGLSHRFTHLPSQLSIGERQRVAIARSLANSPEILFADEPTGNLDSKTQDEVLQLFHRLQREQRTTLIVVTHSEEVARNADRIIRMKDGRVIDVPSSTVRETPQPTA